MPTIFRERGYRFYFYEADLDEPIQVHVVKSGKPAKIWVQPIRVAVEGVLGAMSYPQLKELRASEATKSIPRGVPSKSSGSVAPVKIAIDSKLAPLVPVLIPEIKDVRAFAQQLYQRKKEWQGIAFGWELPIRRLAAHPQRMKMDGA